MRKNILYECEYGYIAGVAINYTDYWVDEFVIYPDFRGKGLANELAKHLPKTCRLIACPLIDKGRQLTTEQLVKFYEKHGFKLVMSAFGENVMQRGTPSLLNTMCQHCEKPCERWLFSVDDAEIWCYCINCDSETFHPYE